MLPDPQSDKNGQVSWSKNLEKKMNAKIANGQHENQVVDMREKVHVSALHALAPKSGEMTTDRNHPTI